MAKHLGTPELQEDSFELSLMLFNYMNTSKSLLRIIQKWLPVSFYQFSLQAWNFLWIFQTNIMPV